MVDGLLLKKNDHEGPGIRKFSFQRNLYNFERPKKNHKGNLKYSLEEIIFLRLSAVISGFQTYELIEGFGEERLDWLRQFYPYKYGRPSHDTLGEFYSKLKPKEFAKCLIAFT
nr:transposase family protein [uncultured Flavobacterium sp.]